MATFTANYALRKPDGGVNGDFVNVATDINASMDTIDTNLKRVDDNAAAQPLAYLYANAGQSLNNQTWTSLNLAAEDIDTHNGHDLVTNNSRYTVPKNGYYKINGSYWAIGHATGVRIVRLAKNGARIVGSGNEVINAGVGASVSAVSPVVIVSAIIGDYFEVQGWQNSGGALDTASGASEGTSVLTVEWLRPN